MKIKVNVLVERGRIVDGVEVPEKFEKHHNLTVDVGLVDIRDHGMATFDIVKYGNGTTAADHADTDLESEVYSSTMTISPATVEGEGYARITYYDYLGTAAGNLGAITELGLFHGTVLIARVIISAETKSATDYIKTIWDCDVLSEEALP